MNSTYEIFNENIALILGSHSPNVHPYHYPFSQKNEIEKFVQDILVTEVIRPSTTLTPPLSSWF